MQNLRIIRTLCNKERDKLGRTDERILLCILAMVEHIFEMKYFTFTMFKAALKVFIIDPVLAFVRIFKCKFKRCLQSLYKSQTKLSSCVVFFEKKKSENNFFFLIDTLYLNYYHSRLYCIYI